MITKVVNFLIFLVIVYVIIRHFLTKSENIKEEDIEDMIRKKTRSLGGVQPRVDRSSRSQVSQKKEYELSKMLQWGASPSEFGDLLSKEFFNSELFFQIKGLEIEGYEEPQYKLTLFNSLMNQFLKDNKNLKFKNYSKVQFKAATLLALGKGEAFFKEFNGSKASVTKMEFQGLFEVQDVDKFLLVVESIIENIQKYFLLNEKEIQNMKKAYSKKELAKMYHPDQMSLNLIPQGLRDGFFKLYSDQFSRLIS